jgi:hypothetical protein
MKADVKLLRRTTKRGRASESHQQDDGHLWDPRARANGVPMVIPGIFNCRYPVSEAATIPVSKTPFLWVLM